jgi:polyhydroxyalkanoate synthesis regulator phasin
MARHRHTTVTKFLQDIIDDTKDFVDDVLDRASDVEDDLSDTISDAVSEDDETMSHEFAALKASLEQLTSKVDQLAKTSPSKSA